MVTEKTVDEIRLEFAACVAAGRPFTSEKAIEIDGADLREFYIAWATLWRNNWQQTGDQLCVKSIDRDEQRSAATVLGGIITPAGIVIDGGKRAAITITGQSVQLRDLANKAGKVIDLSFLAGSEGGPLPPLVFRNCRLDGELLLAGSHFAFLEIDSCQISRINADNCQIDSHCKLTNLKSVTARGKGLAQIRMVAARVHGSLNLHGSLLRAPRPTMQPDLRQFADRYALSLASAEIAGRLHLTNGFTALGGVSLYQATVRHSVSLQGAMLRSHASLSRSAIAFKEAEELSGKSDPRVALDAEELKLAGSFLWTNDKPENAASADESSDIIGQIVLRRAQIAGDCKFQHCRWGGVKAESELNQQLAGFHGGIDARLVRISGQLRFGGGCRVARWSAPPARRFAKELTSGSIGASIDGWKALIGKGVRIEEGATFTGPIFMNDSRIEHGFIMRGKLTTPTALGPAPKVSEGLDLSEARISGRVLIESDISGAVTLRRARIDGPLELHRLTFALPRLARVMDAGDLESGLATILDLSSARISDALHFGELELKHAHAPDKIERRPVIIDLRGLDCRIFDDNEASVWTGLGDRQDWRLLLDGITFGSFDQSNPRYRSKSGTKAEWQLRLPTASGRKESSKNDGPKSTMHLVAARTDMLKAFAPAVAGGHWQKLRANVISAQREEYSPQPYETFARAYFRDGKRREGMSTAKERATLRWCRSAYRWSQYNRAHFLWFAGTCILFALLCAILMNIDNKDTILETSMKFILGHPWTSPGGWTQIILAIGVRWLVLSTAFVLGLWASPKAVLATGWLFKAGFQYGFSPGRACVTLFVSLLLGVIVANNLPLHPLSRLQLDGSSADVPVRHASTERIAVEGCNLVGDNRVDRSLYAIDVFIPLIDLHQECGFFIAEKDKYLRLATSIYAGLGWVIVSLTLLTFSGILRRDLEV
jgi:hypothetical protein